MSESVSESVTNPNYRAGPFGPVKNTIFKTLSRLSLELKSGRSFFGIICISDHYSAPPPPPFPPLTEVLDGILIIVYIWSMVIDL